MSSRLVLTALILVISLPACRTPTPAQLGMDRTIRPAWIPSPNKSHPDLIYVTGACRGVKHRFLARNCAVLDAEVQLRRLTTDASVKVRGNFVEDEFFERRPVTPSASELAYDWWVLVAFPRKELPGAARRPAGEGTAAVSAEERRLLDAFRALDASARQALLTILEQLARGAAATRDR